MIIALDYDSTYTCDPQFWDKFIDMCKMHEHVIYCVTMRDGENHEADDVLKALQYKVDRIYFTSCKGKRKYMYEQGIHIHVWIDDTPDFIILDAKS